jgi:ADP-heptose:LPS heptosyltransferase
MHVAQVFEKQGVVFFGSILPETRLISKNLSAVNAKNLNCLGCHHRKALPCTSTTSCEIGIQECINDVTVEMMWSEIKNKLNNNK